MNKTLFKEVQKYRQPWVWLIIIPLVSGTFIFFAFGINQQLIDGNPFGDNPMSNTGLILTAIFSIIAMLGITILFYTMRMITEIREDGILFRYPPLLNKEKVIPKNEISIFEVRTYQPIREYGGWGIKVSAGKNGKAYNVRGKTGLQLVLKSGEKILLGTQRGPAILTAMNKMMNNKTSLNEIKQ
ncbi:MAG: hypothetical protein KDC05_11750 [Bacteroidales bacterium]|nr:hypothetical protein [Bacteroidales bacterium]